MKFNIEVDTSDFYREDNYGDEMSFEEHIINKIIDELTTKISHSKHWQETYIIQRLLDNFLKNSNGTIKNRFSQAIENKINRSNINSKVNKVVNGITEESITKSLVKDINVEKIIKNEVRKIMEEKFK